MGNGRRQGEWVACNCSRDVHGLRKEDSLPGTCISGLLAPTFTRHILYERFGLNEAKEMKHNRRFCCTRRQMSNWLLHAKVLAVALELYSVVVFYSPLQLRQSRDMQNSTTLCKSSKHSMLRKQSLVELYT
jgi:hypothetical protein